MHKRRFINTEQQGFTLVELAVVIVIVGLVMGGILATIKPILFQSRLTATEANMNRMIDVVSAYAQRNNRIPCPADPDQSAAAQPYGAEIGSGAAGSAVGSCPPGGPVEGIVPFLTLGLDPDDVRDGWGNFVTYRVSPVFALDTAAAAEIHKRCRTNGVWVSVSNRNPSKARFCCTNRTVPPATDISLSDDGGVSLWPFTRDTSAGAFSGADDSYSGAPFDPASDNVTAIAFVLVGHGQNEYGAFLPDGTRLTAIGAFGNGETENQNGDESFVAAPMSFSSTSAHFEDIVMWRTQDQLFAETGAGSCSFP